MSTLPDELWRRILEIGVQRGSFSYKDLCRISISSARLRRLSDEDSLWSHLLSSDLPTSSSITSPNPSTSKSLYKIRFERERDKKMAAHRRAVLRKESQVVERSMKLREMEARLAEETQKMQATLTELSSLSRIRQASVALNVWQPEIVRGRQKQIVEQCVVPVESRFHSLEMELKLCKQHILGLEKAHVSLTMLLHLEPMKDEKRRLALVEEELQSMRYHPLRNHEQIDCGDIEYNIKRKKLKRCKGQSFAFGCFISLSLPSAF
ncbi:hypothetical protein ACFX10_008444 [Malus domestica]